MKNPFIYSLLFCYVLAACNSSQNSTDTNSENAIAAPNALSYELIKVYPHDTSSYTQGLEWNGHKLIEGTGLEGKSILQILDTNMNLVGSKVKLDKEFFGEGTTLFKDKIYQLTWQNHKVFVYDANTFKKEKEFNWNYEGWGITHYNNQLIISTGSSNLYFVNPTTLAIEKTLGVYDNNGYIASLNELEMIDGKIYANVWGDNKIIVINPTSGQVEKQFDFTDILQKSNQPITTETNVLNGIAYDSISKAAYITGKNWPAIFKVSLQ